MAWLKGKHLKQGRYLVTAEIDGYASGLSYQGIDQEASTGQGNVMILTPREDLQSWPGYSSYRTSFAQQAESLASMETQGMPYLPRVLDFFTADNLPCLVVESPQGVTLTETVTRIGILSFAEVQLLIAQIGGALSFLHQRGICHGDINPNNILLLRQDRSVLININLGGTAKNRLLRKQLMPQSDYQSPELRDGDRIGVACDLYSLGGCLYFALTGYPPQWLDEEHAYLKRPAALNSSIPPEMERLIMQALEYSIPDRPDSLASWLNQLAAVSDRQNAIPENSLEGSQPGGRRLNFLSRWFRRLKLSVLACVRALKGLLPQALFRKDVAKPYDQGLKYFSAGNYDKAIACFETALAQQPELEDAWYLRGMALAEMNDHPGAIASYDKALALNPNHLKCLNERACLLGQAQQYKAAIAGYDQVLALDPNYHSAWNNRGNMLAALGQKEAAIASYEEALALDADYTEAWNNRGNLLVALGSFAAAIESFQKALALNPEHLTAWNSCAIALSNLGRNEEAVQHCDQALDHDPKFYEAWLTRGFALFALQRHDEALISFDNVLGADPSANAMACYGKATILAQRQETAIAVSHLKKAITFNPKYLASAKGDRSFDPIRNEPDFQKLLQSAFANSMGSGRNSLIR